MRLYAIIAACLTIGIPAATSATAMQSITNEDECKAAGGSCTNRDDCPLANNVFQEECGGTYDGCCIPKETVCASKNGSFMPKSECDLKSGYHDTGLHLGDDNCYKMKSYGIIFVVILMVFISGDGKGNGERHINIKTKEDCEAFDGECNKPKDCNLTQSVHMEPASGGTCGGDELDFCCIAKEFMCVHHANGTFIPDAECNAKPGFTASGLELNGLNCCKPEEDEDDASGTAVSRLSSGAVVLMIAVCAYRMF
ncbi:hypothetical protein NP493_147g01004 [Ridgeia piscesae]|uniref:Uncharacterized protein n=1 Tax=Ridgeia piscesae TaxID=27915 RepID=A0AAD9P4U8_RIDPI|nr:hypothetical protein NP493_147g01004 [Ridgeia piscesae]